ncbi:uncharacterized protein LOC131660481 [Vicia villosa]|uniref:uncharacterized protein LOC131660481 n=1 Tax=Vicia villosa TaxID=3911 RepID=UPI00273CBD40|nr:uncharacterized protein LOC131660481 [Vicia villosa]
MVNWRAMESILQEVEIPRIFIDWIMDSVTTVSYKFNVNLTDFMQAKRGIRHGDPLPPLLFVIIMEYMHRTMQKMQLDTNFKHHANCKKLKLTNLIFADDVLLFCRGDPTSVEKMQNAFKAFTDSTGLVANPTKSTMFCGGVDTQMQQRLHTISGFKEGVFPVKYLGVPLTHKRLNIQHYLPLIDKIVARIHHWTSKLLTYAGRVQLVKSIIVAIAQYWMSCFPLLKFVLKKIDSICRSFIWTGDEHSRKSSVSWDIMCRPYAQGGLQVINLQVWNKVLMLKCLWNLCRLAENLWVQ